jgi:hypothetical protein
MTCVKLFTGRDCDRFEIQPRFVRTARELTECQRLSRAPFIVGDAVELTAFLPIGTVFFLYVHSVVCVLPTGWPRSSQLHARRPFGSAASI